MPVNFCELSKRLLDALSHMVHEIECRQHCHCHCHTEDKEGILLPFGDHVVTVKTDFVPKEVFVSITDDGLAVCGGDVSTAGVTLEPDGFVLYVHIKSDSGIVRWIAKGE